MEYDLTAIAAIEEVVTHVGDGGSSGPWHDLILQQGISQPQYSFRPLFCRVGDGGSSGPWHDLILQQGIRQPQYSFRPLFQGTNAPPEGVGSGERNLVRITHETT